MSNPPDKPGRLAIVFFDESADNNSLMKHMMAVALDAGYTVDEQNQNSVLLERGY